MKVQAKNQDTILDFFYSPISPSILYLSSPISSKSKINLETFTSVHLVDTKLPHSCLEDCKDPLKSLCLYASLILTVWSSGNIKITACVKFWKPFQYIYNEVWTPDHGLQDRKVCNAGLPISVLIAWHALSPHRTPTTLASCPSLKHLKCIPALSPLHLILTSFFFLGLCKRQTLLLIQYSVQISLSQRNFHR